jgi:glyoxylase-like metal-dependent hydrolase (beta-lactamase superfamily II)
MQIQRIEIPTPLPVGPVNAYFLPGDPPTLIDAGPKTEETRAALEAGLGAAGFRVDEIRRIILTHGHTDHFGYAASIQQQSGAEIFGHEADRSKFSGERWIVGHLSKFFTEAGLPQAFLQSFVDTLRGYRELFDPIPHVTALQDGDEVSLGGARLRVLHCPGHSQGHICLYHDDGELIAGDLLLETISPNPVVEFTAEGKRIPTLPQYLQSLRRVLILNCDVAFPGHGTPIANPSARIRELIAHHDQRKEQIRGLLGPTPKTLQELTQEIYHDLDHINMMLALSEMVGHLDLLIEEKRASVQRRGRTLLYKAK